MRRAAPDQLVLDWDGPRGHAPAAAPPPAPRLLALRCLDCGSAVPDAAPFCAACVRRLAAAEETGHWNQDPEPRPTCCDVCERECAPEDLTDGALSHFNPWLAVCAACRAPYSGGDRCDLCDEETADLVDALHPTLGSYLRVCAVCAA